MAFLAVALLLALLSPSPRSAHAATVTCPSGDDPLARATRPVITPAPPQDACSADSLAIYFPPPSTAACATDGDRECVRGDGCAFQCIPRIDRNTGWFLSLVTDAAVVDEVAGENLARPGATSIVINASLVAAWAEGGKRLPTYLLPTYSNLFITGNEAANANFGSTAQDNKLFAPGTVVPFVLPASFFASVTELFKLTLENVNVTMPPVGTDATLKFQSLTTLSLRNTLLTSFPLPLASFPKLTHVDLSANFLSKVAKWGFPETLSGFNVSSNQIRSIDEDALPKQLQILDLSGNPLTAIPRGTLPPTLLSLFLAATNLTELPADIADLTALRQLALNDNRLGSSLLDKATFNDALVTLDVSDCSLTNIPSALRTSKLETVVMGRNDLSRKPDFTRLPPSLKVLGLASCQIQNLSQDLLGFVNLEQLDLSDNRGTMNDLSMLPTSLQSLALNDNALSSIPSRIQSLGSLQKLQILGNPLKQLASGNLPQTLTDLIISDASFSAVELNTLPISLTRLSIANSQLNTVPNDVRVLPSLKSLILTGCRLGSFSFTEMLPALNLLDLHNNTLTTFSGQMPLVTSIDLSRNALQEFKLASNAVLQSLSLAKNNLTKVPTAVFLFPALKKLNLSQNPIRNFSPSAVEFKFLSQIPTIVFDQAMFASNCASTTLLNLHGYRVCDPGPGTVSSSRNTTTVVVITVCGVLAVVAVVIAVQRRNMFHKVGQQGREEESPRRDKRRLYEATASVWSDPLLLQHRLDVQHVHSVRLLDFAGDSDVWLASYLHEYVVVKTLKPSVTTLCHDRLLQFADQIRLSLSLSHPRILSAVGVLWSTVSDLSLVTEYLVGGDLRAYLAVTASSHGEPWTDIKTQIALDITEALVYLHSLDPIVIHGHLHSRHILLDGELRPKIGNAGVIASVSDDISVIATAAVYWIAPEILTAEPYDESTDIYSLGVLLSEMDTHTLPFMDGSSPSVYQFTAACPLEIRSLAQRCLSLDSSARPSGLQVAYELRLLLSPERGPDPYAK